MLAPLLVCLALAGCHHEIANEDAVKQGVMDYLSSRQGLNIASMNVSVTSMVFRQNEVYATVVFSPKQAAGGAQPMTIAYTLEKKGERWVVKPRANAANPHGGMGASPHGGMAPPEGSGAPAGALPPGHPTVPPPSAPQ